MRVLLGQGRPEPERPEPERPRPLLRTALGGVLRRIRLGQGRTLGAVARAAGVSMQYLSELERGRKEGSSEVLAAICDALGIGLADLLAEARHDLAATGRAPGTVVRLPMADQLAPPPDGLAPDGLGSAPERTAPQACLRAA
jgi:transcriptional regulator with XRE-family HTH domain